jgi:putative membrane protein
MMWWGHGFDGISWEWMLSGGLMMVLFWGGLIALAVLILRTFSSSQQRAGSVSALPSSNTALDILKERYAQGEITKAEFEEMRDDLKT